MTALLWWSDITGDTPLRDIGWTWVILALMVAYVCWALIALSIAIWKKDSR